MTTKYKYIYGPVSSWRIGSSLGIDPISENIKVCSFDCTYCQIGRTGILTDQRKIFVDSKAVIDELRSFPDINVDYITFSGRGEPTLAKNLGVMIREVKKNRGNKKIAVITNSSLLYREDVQQELSLADFVLTKLDASSQQLFRQINRPIEIITFDKIVSSLKKFRKVYPGKMALQIMFVEENKKHAENLSNIAKEINPDEVHLNTPLRECSSSALNRKEMDVIEKAFAGMATLSIYNAERKAVIPVSDPDTLKRRGKSFKT